MTVVTTKASEGAYGVTVSSFASLSLNPLLVTVSVNRSSQLLRHLRAAEAFAVSVLASDQQQVASYFATTGRQPEPAGFSTVATTEQQTGAPIIDGCLSWFDCTLEEVLPGGDHEILGRSRGRSRRPYGRAAGLLGRRISGLVAADMPRPDQMANASDGLAVAYHVLDVDPAEMLDAQNSIEPAIAALAAGRTPAREWDRLEQLVDQSELVVEEPDEFNRLALAFHSAIAHASGNRVLQATLASLGQVQSTHYRDYGSAQIGSRCRRRTSAVARCAATRRSRSGPR